MNKKLIAVAVAGALAAPLAATAADGVTLYGSVQAEYQSTKIDQATSASDHRQEAISDNSARSRWGFRITEDLGNGLKANAQVAYAFRPGTGTVDSVREQWVGLSSKSWGEVQFGRVNAPFKNFIGGSTIDPFITTSLQSRGFGGAMYAPANGFGAAGFVDHALRYDSPEFGGFAFSVLVAPSDATQAEGTTGQGNVGGRGGANNYQIALKYKFGSSGEIFGGYSQDDASDAQRAVAAVNGKTADDEEVWKIGGAWNFGDFRIAGQYEDINNALAGNGGTSCAGGATGNGNNDTGISVGQCNTALNTNGDGKIWFLTAQYKIGNTRLVVQGGRAKGDAEGTSVERTSRNFTVGAIYNFSKRTSVFGGYQRVSIDGGRNSTNSIDSTQAQVNTAVQPDRSTWNVGIRHDF